MKKNWMLIGLGVLCLALDWKSAEPGWRYEFPRDHHSHTDSRLNGGISPAIFWMPREIGMAMS